MWRFSYRYLLKQAFYDIPHLWASCLSDFLGLVHCLYFSAFTCSPPSYVCRVVSLSGCFLSLDIYWFTRYRPKLGSAVHHLPGRRVLNTFPLPRFIYPRHGLLLQSDTAPATFATFLGSVLHSAFLVTFYSSSCLCLLYTFDDAFSLGSGFYYLCSALLRYNSLWKYISVPIPGFSSLLPRCPLCYMGSAFTCILVAFAASGSTTYMQLRSFV